MVSESYDTDDLENGGEPHRPNLIHGLKRRSSVTLKAIVRTFSVPGGKCVVRFPSPPQPQSQTVEEEEERESSGAAETPKHERSAACYSNAMTDVEITATEAAGGETADSHVTPALVEAKVHSVGSTSC